jgi:hypothetical protein
MAHRCLTALLLAVGLLAARSAVALTQIENVTAFDQTLGDVDPNAPDHLVLDLIRPDGIATAVADTQPSSFFPLVAESHLLLSASGSSTTNGSAHALTQFPFTIVGPATTDPIPLLIDAQVVLDVAGTTSVPHSEANAFLTHPGGEIRFDACAGSCVNFDDLFNETMALLVPANQLLPLALGANATAAGVAPGVRNVNAVVRVALRIDPSFPLASQYRIVPEPATALLVALGAAALASRKRA